MVIDNVEQSTTSWLCHVEHWTTTNY